MGLGFSQMARHSNISQPVQQVENVSRPRRMNVRQKRAMRMVAGDSAHLSIFARIFLGFIAVVVVLAIVLPDRTFSESENRSLQGFPIPTIQTILNGRFQENFQTYIDDQFPFRDLWAGMQAVISTAVGGIDSNGVYLGTDGYLIQDFQRPQHETATDAIVEFVRANPDLPTYALIAPTAVSVLSDKLPATAVPDDQNAYISEVDARLTDAGARVIDVRETFAEHKDEGLYYKSDHHWTTYGAYLAFRQACEVMGLDADAAPFEAVEVANDFDGTLKSKSGYFFAPSDPIEVYLPSGEGVAEGKHNYLVTYVDEQRVESSPYNVEALNQKDKYQVFMGGNHPVVRIETLADNHEVLLVVKDSYANCFVPFMAEEYSKVVVVDPRYYFDDIATLMSSEEVTQVLFLYNATTYAEDTSLASMIDASYAADRNNEQGEQDAEGEQDEQGEQGEQGGEVTQ